MGRTWNFDNSLFRVNGNIKTPTSDNEKGQRNSPQAEHDDDDEHEDIADHGSTAPLHDANSPNTKKGKRWKKFRNQNKNKHQNANGPDDATGETALDGIEVIDDGLIQNVDKELDLNKVANRPIFLFDPKYVTSMNVNLEFTTNCYYQLVPPFSVKLSNSYNNANQKGLNTVLKLDLQFPYDHLRKVRVLCYF